MSPVRFALVLCFVSLSCGPTSEERDGGSTGGGSGGGATGGGIGGGATGGGIGGGATGGGIGGGATGGGIGGGATGGGIGGGATGGGIGGGATGGGIGGGATGGGIGGGAPSAPTIVSTSPMQGATNVMANTVITIVFSEPMSASTFTASSVSLRRGSTTLQTMLAYDDMSRTLTLTPTLMLQSNAAHVVTLTSAVRDANDNLPLSSGSTFLSFHTPYTPGLSALTMSEGPLTPAFSTSTLSYAATVASTVTTLTFTATTASPAAGLKLNTTFPLSGVPSQPQPVAQGANTYAIEVQTPDMAVTTYTVVVTRP